LKKERGKKTRGKCPRKRGKPKEGSVKKRIPWGYKGFSWGKGETIWVVAKGGGKHEASCKKST